MRPIDLTRTNALLVIDNDGYSNALVTLANPDDIAVPAKAGIRQAFVFEGSAEGIEVVCLWGKDLSVKWIRVYVKVAPPRRGFFLPGHEHK